MKHRDLSLMMAPKAVALVGASEKKGFGYWTAFNLLQSKDHLKIYFVHPKRDSVLGLPCYRTLSDIPDKIDCVILATRKETVPGLLKEAGELGIKNAMVYASGFAEEHSEIGRQLEDELVKISETYNMNILGPNCMGLINNVDKVNTLGLQTADDAFQRKPYVGIVAQSGAMANIFMKRAGFPVAYQITTGNSAVLGVEDFLDYMVDDDRIRTIAVYIEGIKKTEILIEALRKAAQKRKPVIIFKAGKSAIGAKAASSHTGSLAGTHSIYAAAFKKYGAIEVNCMEELICLSQAFAAMNGNFPENDGLASYNLSGGANIMSADYAEEYGIRFAKLLPETLDTITKYIPSYAVASNPLDATTDLFGQTDRIVEILKAMDQDPDVGIITITQDIAAKGTEIVKGMVEAVIEGKKQGIKKPVFFNCITEMDRNIEIRNQLEEFGVGILSSMPVAYSCLRKIIDRSIYRYEDHDFLVKEMRSKAGLSSFALSEAESKKEIKKYNIRMPEEALVTEKKDIDKCNIKFPWVMKIQSKDILHKTDLGCVKLNIQSVQDGYKAFDEIIKNAGDNLPNAQVDGVVIQEMAKKGDEFIIGIQNTSNMGPQVLIGAGGILTEVFKDVAIMPAPVRLSEALEMIEGLKSAKVLHGFRGSSKKDVMALANTIVAVSEYAYENSDDLKEMDLNPVVVYDEGEGICVLDALVIKYTDNKHM